jgi:uncharacterized protein (DUF2062 family)
MGMVDIVTESNSFPDTVHVELPGWFKILVCVGSAMVGGYFGGPYWIIGIVSGSIGGVVVAIFWLRRISRFQTKSVTVAIFGGIGWGIVAGLIDTVWLHATTLAILFSRVLGPEKYHHLDIIKYWDIVLLIAFLCGVGAGAVYGLICMIILEVHRARMRKRDA